MPSAGKAMVELVDAREQHLAWVDVPAGFRPQVATEPVVLLWGPRVFVWQTVSQAGFFVFREAAVIVSRTPAPGLPAPLGRAGT